MTKAVIFDFDGLLVNTEIISFYIYRDMLKKFGFSYSKEEYARNYSGKTGVANMRRLIDTYHLPYSPEEGLAVERKLEEEYLAKGVELKKGAHELLEYLKDNSYKIAVASSSTAQRAMNILKAHQIDHYFDAFVFAEDISRSKPDPEIFLKAAGRLNTDVSECLVLEDSEAGIEAASQGNIPVICIPDMKMPSEQQILKTAAVLRSLDEVIEWMNKI